MSCCLKVAPGVHSQQAKWQLYGRQNDFHYCNEKEFLETLFNEELYSSSQAYQCSCT